MSAVKSSLRGVGLLSLGLRARRFQVECLGFWVRFSEETPDSKPHRGAKTEFQAARHMQKCRRTPGLRSVLLPARFPCIHSPEHPSPNDDHKVQSSTPSPTSESPETCQTKNKTSVLIIRTKQVILTNNNNDNIHNNSHTNNKKKRKKKNNTGPQGVM